MIWKALLEKAGLQEDPLVASKTFNQRDQLQHEKVDEYAGVLKRLFRQAYLGEETNSAVLLQRFITGLRPSILRQMLLRKKPTNLAEAMTNAVAVEYALQFDHQSHTDPEPPVADPVNALHQSGTNKPHAHQDDVAKLHKTVEALTKQVESLQTALQKPPRAPRPWRNHGFSVQNQQGCRRDRLVGPCGQEGHHYRQLLWASSEGGRSLARPPIIHQSTLTDPGKHINTNNVLRVHGLMGSSPVQFLLDSGAPLSVVCYGALQDLYRRQMTTPDTPTAVAANGAPLDLVGQVTIPISIAEFTSTHRFIVAHNITVDCILGIDFLLQHGVVIDCKKHSIVSVFPSLYQLLVAWINNLCAAYQ